MSAKKAARWPLFLLLFSAEHQPAPSSLSPQKKAPGRTIIPLPVGEGRVRASGRSGTKPTPAPPPSAANCNTADRDYCVSQSPSSDCERPQMQRLTNAAHLAAAHRPMMGGVQLRAHHALPVAGIRKPAIEPSVSASAADAPPCSRPNG